MKRYIALGIVVFLCVGIALAPASLIDRALAANSNVDLVSPRGTLWQGQGQLLATNMQLGQLAWDFQPFSLLGGSATYHWSLVQGDRQLYGQLAMGLGQTQIDVEGHLDEFSLNTWLNTYDITISGDIEISPSQALIDTTAQQINELEGQLDWGGGIVRYTLSGLLRESTLPPLTAYLSVNAEGEPQATVYAQGEQTPLIIASIAPNGFARVGITKLFTRMLNNPWPGSDPDHTIVLEVEEKII